MMLYICANTKCHVMAHGPWQVSAHIPYTYVLDPDLYGYLPMRIQIGLILYKSRSTDPDPLHWYLPLWLYRYVLGEHWHYPGCSDLS